MKERRIGENAKKKGRSNKEMIGLKEKIID